MLYEPYMDGPLQTIDGLGELSVPLRAVVRRAQDRETSR
jgi:hypothetical protein